MQIIIELDRQSSRALVRWLRRFTWTDIMSSATSAEEARAIREGITNIRHGLSEAGFT